MCCETFANSAGFTYINKRQTDFAILRGFSFQENKVLAKIFNFTVLFCGKICNLNFFLSRVVLEIIDDVKNLTGLLTVQIPWYSKTCVKQPLSKRPKISFLDQLSPNAVQKYCRML